MDKSLHKCAPFSGEIHENFYVFVVKSFKQENMEVTKKLGLQK